MKEFDLIVIGSGPAGEKALSRRLTLAARVALTEKEERLGGRRARATIHSFTHSFLNSSEINSISTSPG